MFKSVEILIGSTHRSDLIAAPIPSLSLGDGEQPLKSVCRRTFYLNSQIWICSTSGIRDGEQPLKSVCRPISGIGDRQNHRSSMLGTAGEDIRGSGSVFFLLLKTPVPKKLRIQSSDAEDPHSVIVSVRRTPKSIVFCPSTEGGAATELHPVLPETGDRRRRRQRFPIPTVAAPLPLREKMTQITAGAENRRCKQLAALPFS